MQRAQQIQQAERIEGALDLRAATASLHGREGHRAFLDHVSRILKGI